MKTARVIMMIVLVALVAGLPALAQQKGDSAMPQMPPFGPPAEMQQVAKFIGTWKFQGEMRMDPTREWTKNEATCVFSYVAGGAALQMEYSGPMMGMEMKGLSLTGFDRESGKWQSVWTDNLAGRISYYEGDFKDGKLVVSGKELMQGMTMFSRTTFYDITDKTIQWTMESSMDGQTWAAVMRGTYTKQ